MGDLCDIVSKKIKKKYKKKKTEMEATTPSRVPSCPPPTFFFFPTEMDNQAMPGNLQLPEGTQHGSQMILVLFLPPGAARALGTAAGPWGTAEPTAGGLAVPWGRSRRLIFTLPWFLLLHRS